MAQIPAHTASMIAPPARVTVPSRCSKWKASARRACGKSAARKVKHGGWPTALHAEKSSTHCRPIVPGATFSVRCPCGFAHDSAAPSEDAALAEMRTRHDCGSPFMVAEPVVDLPDPESDDARIARLEALVQSLVITVEKLRFENIVKGALPDEPAPDDDHA